MRVFQETMPRSGVGKDSGRMVAMVEGWRMRGSMGGVGDGVCLGVEGVGLGFGFEGMQPMVRGVGWVW